MDELKTTSKYNPQARIGCVTTSIYHISPGYRKLTIYCADSNGQRFAEHTSIPRTKDRMDRYDVIVKRIEREGMTPPPYKPTKKEASDG